MQRQINPQNLYFDNEAWTILYLVVETGSRLPGRKVLITRQHKADFLDCDS